MLGVNAPDGKGNITAYATYVQNNPVLAANCDFTACTLNSGAQLRGRRLRRLRHRLPGPRSAASSSTRPDPATPSAPRTGDRRLQLRAGQLSSCGPTSATAWAPSPTTRSPALGQAYTDTMFMDDNSTAQIAPGGIFARPDLAALRDQLRQPAAVAPRKPARSARPGGRPAPPTRPASSPARSRRRQRRRRRPPDRSSTTDYRIVRRPEGRARQELELRRLHAVRLDQLNQQQTGNNFLTSRINQALNARAQRRRPDRLPVGDRRHRPGLRAAQLLHARRRHRRRRSTSCRRRRFSSGNTIEQVASLNFAGKLGRLRHQEPVGQRQASASRSAPSTAASTWTPSPTSCRPTACVNGNGARRPAGERRLRRLRAVRRSPRAAGPGHALRQGHHRSSSATASRTTPRRQHQHLQGGRRLGRRSTACASAPATTAPSAPRTWSSCSRRRTWCSTATPTPAPA